MIGNYILALFVMLIGIMFIVFTKEIQRMWESGAKQDGMPFSDMRQAYARSGLGYWVVRGFGILFVALGAAILLGYAR